MNFKMTKKLDNIFGTCNESTLSPKLTALVTFAAQLSGNSKGANGYLNKLGEAESLINGKYGDGESITSEELSRVACLCACTAGAPAREAYVSALSSARVKGASKAVEGERFQSCSAESLDKKTHHLVSLAACLASGCQCASGHIVEARNAGATPEELARCACIAACVSGLKVKYEFLSHLQSTKSCRACVC